MDKEDILRKTEKIKKKYEKIYKTLFTYGIFFVIIVFALIKSQQIINQPEEKKSISAQNLEIQKDKLISAFQKREENGKENSGIQILLRSSEIKIDETSIQSYNNLIMYKGYIVPRFFRISKTFPLPDITYFETTGYSLSDIDTFFKNIIISRNKGTVQTINRTQLPIQTTIIETFNLQCLFQAKIYNGICNIFVKEFLDSFFIYTIQADMEGFTTVFKKIIQKNNVKEKACKQLFSYIVYTDTTDGTTESLIENCGEQYSNDFKTFTYFQEIQKELESKLISNKIYNDSTINTYKLISFQQIMYDDIANKRINNDRINSYFAYIQELLKRNKISKFYKEVIYYFNNYYLKKYIDSPEIINKTTEKNILNDINKQIENINNGNSLIGFEGLTSQINPNIIIKENIYTAETDQKQSEEDIINNLLNQVGEITIKEKFFSGNNVLLQGNRKFPEKDILQENKIHTIGIKLWLEENNKTLYVKQLFIQEHDELSQTINGLIQKENRSFATLQKYLYQNKSLLSQNTQTSNNDTDKTCQSLKENLPDQEVQICNENKILIDMVRKNKIITISIIHNNFILNSINISDIDAKNILNQYLNQPEIGGQIVNNGINKDTIIPFIKQTIEAIKTYAPQPQNNNFEGGSTTIIIIEKIKTYLGVQVTDIAEKNDKILLEFTINGINFIANYVLAENKIYPIYFKNVLKNGIPTIIRNLSLTLTEENKQQIDVFSKNPLEVIKQKSPEDYLFYQKFISQ